MNKKTMMTAFVVAAVLLTAGSALAAPEVSNVSMEQITGTRQVKITYNLTNEAAIITLSIETNGAAISDSAVTWLTGDVNKVVAVGTGRRILWNAGVDWPENVTETAKARVTAWSTNAPPQVMVINLSGGSATNAYPVLYYTSMETLPYGGVTNTIYKSTRLVMRKIAPGGFTMGEGTGSKEVVLTSSFYAGVFQVTQGQWYNVMGTLPSYFTDISSRMFRPVERVSYHEVRENPDTNKPLDFNWPQTDVVGADSFMGLLQSKIGLAGFDLPTEAQWEYACRATTISCFNDGEGNANVTGVNENTNVWLDALGRYKFNGGDVNGAVLPATDCGPENGTAIVGSYLPNKWGLYDMHGNVWEWCLDWHMSASVMSGGVDPVGATSGVYRVHRGAAWNFKASACRSAMRSCDSPSAHNKHQGFRLVRNLP